MEKEERPGQVKDSTQPIKAIDLCLGVPLTGLQCSAGCCTGLTCPRFIFHRRLQMQDMGICI
jgi:hypothetical protein